MTPFSAALFDLDGVLVDTAEDHYLAWKQIADELNVPFDRIKNERLRGVPRMESLRIILEDVDPLPSNLDDLAARKNDGLLPLAKKVKKIAVMGPSADKTRLGGYTCENPDSISPLQGILARAPHGVEVTHVEGCKLVDPSKRDTVPAVVEQWYAGAECGNALATILWGDANPAGRLPITFPASVGQLPLYYNPRPHGRVSDYMDHRGKLELFEFGYGLSYTTFAYSDLKVRKRKKGDAWVLGISFTLENTGIYDGDEVAQLYIRDLFSRITRPIKELKAFERVSLKKGESKRITFTLTPEDLSFLDENLKPALEAGDFRLMVGASSCDIRLETDWKLPEKDAVVL